MDDKIRFVVFSFHVAKIKDKIVGPQRPRVACGGFLSPDKNLMQLVKCLL